MTQQYQTLYKSLLIYTSSLSEKLSAPVSGGSGNMFAGQKQLLHVLMLQSNAGFSLPGGSREDEVQGLQTRQLDLLAPDATEDNDFKP